MERHRRIPSEKRLREPRKAPNPQKRRPAVLYQASSNNGRQGLGVAPRWGVGECVSGGGGGGSVSEERNSTNSSLTVKPLRIQR